MELVSNISNGLFNWVFWCSKARIVLWTTHEITFCSWKCTLQGVFFISSFQWKNNKRHAISIKALDETSIDMNEMIASHIFNFGNGFSMNKYQFFFCYCKQRSRIICLPFEIIKCERWCSNIYSVQISFQWYCCED